MTARVLVVDDVIQNVKLLEAKLTSEYFEVLTALNGKDALEIIRKERPDIVLLDVMMPGMDGFEVCRQIRANEKSAHIPVIMVTALDQPKNRVTGLEAGADDFLTKPVRDLPLFARVRSLVRTKLQMDELCVRETTGENFGMDMDSLFNNKISLDHARILLIEDCRAAERISRYLEGLATIDIDSGKLATIIPADLENYDLFILSLSLDKIDGLRLCSQLRSSKYTRRIPILVLGDEEAQVIKSMELGATDYITRPIDKNELLARAKSQIRQKRSADRLRRNIQKSIEMSMTDAVTELYNRHFLEEHLDNLILRENNNHRQIALLMLDIDKFKPVNDTHGHAAGDEVLAEFAGRISDNIRNIDLAARLGGDEFVVVMPGGNRQYAKNIAERLRKAIADEPFKIIASDQPVTVTVSIGVSLLGGKNLSRTDLLNAADKALYQAKGNGRNQICFEEDIAAK